MHLPRHLVVRPEPRRQELLKLHLSLRVQTVNRLFESQFRLRPTDDFPQLIRQARKIPQQRHAGQNRVLYGASKLSVEETQTPKSFHCF